MASLVRRQLAGGAQQVDVGIRGGGVLAVADQAIGVVELGGELIGGSYGRRDFGLGRANWGRPAAV